MKILDTEWYVQRGGVVPLFCDYGFRGSMKNYKAGYVFVKDGTANFYLPLKGLKMTSDNILKHQLKDNKYVDHLFNEWKKENCSFVTAINRISSLNNLSDAELIRRINNFKDSYYEWWAHGVQVDSFDPFGYTIVAEKVKPNLLDYKFEDLIMAKPSNQQEEEIQILKLGVKLTTKEKNELKIKTKEAFASTDISKKLSHHARQYHWILNAYSHVEELDAYYFFKKLKKIRNPKKELKEIELFWNNRTLLIKKFNADTRIPKEAKNIVHLFRILTEWRELRKKITQIECHASEQIAKEISNRTGIDKSLIYFYDIGETKKILDHPKQVVETLKEKKKVCTLIAHGKGRWVTGKDALSLNEQLHTSILEQNKELKGFCASPGKVRARVKIIHGKPEFHKMKKGDILVTGMTRPEFMPILSKASAIITDEGGITSHAAIVAREFKIPCVIGTQFATSVLKDNDLVEVDANKGTVKKL